MTRAAHWLRIGLACGLLWAGTAIATPDNAHARAPTCIYATGAATPTAAARAAPRATNAARARRAASSRSCERLARVAVDRPLAPRPPQSCQQPARTRIYLQNCVLLR